MRWLVSGIHVLVLACAVSIPVALFNGTLFSWHPTLMAIAFLGLMAEGVLTSISFRTLVYAPFFIFCRVPMASTFRLLS